MYQALYSPIRAFSPTIQLLKRAPKFNHHGLVKFAARVTTQRYHSKDVTTTTNRETDDHENNLAEGDEGDETVMSNKLFQSFVHSLETRGFHRNLKQYTPPHDVKDKILAAYLDVFGDQTKRDGWEETALNDGRTKFKFLVKCIKEIGYSLHNSQLHKMKTVGDVIKFYQSPVNSQHAYDDLMRCGDDELPPNMHIIKDPMRFHPDTDTRFGGVSAFPRSSTIMVDLRLRKKYKGYKADKTWPFTDLPS